MKNDPTIKWAVSNIGQFFRASAFIPIFPFTRLLKLLAASAVHFGFPLRQLSFFIHNSASASRHGQFITDFLDDRFAGFFPGPGFVFSAPSARHKDSTPRRSEEHTSELQSP